jgi:polyisoprenoid-binding protein YceI
MKRVLTFILITAITTLGVAQVKHTLTKSAITYKIKNMGFNTGGTIGGVQANINFSKDKPEASTIEATADVNTLNTDNDSRDTHLKSADFFDVAKYPKINIKSNSIKHKSGNNYLGNFNVTIKDKTKAIDIPFTYVVNGTVATFKGGFKMLRTDFGIGDKGVVLANDLTVDINIETTQ